MPDDADPYELLGVERPTFDPRHGSEGESSGAEATATTEWR